jgi:hypothetical protein
VVRGGAAGTIFFAWRDEWFTRRLGDHRRAFGLLSRWDREPKKESFTRSKRVSATRRLDHESV